MNKPNYLLFKKCSKCGEILHVSKFHKIKTIEKKVDMILQILIEKNN